MRSWRGMVRLFAGGTLIGFLGLLACPVVCRGQTAEASKKYEEARQRAQRAWDQIQYEELTPEAAARLRAEALRDFRFALAHAPADASVDDLNSLRYGLAYLHWATEEYYDAAVLGEFLARCYPDAPVAQQGAIIALAAYARLFRDSGSADERTFERDRMRRIAQFIAERWPDSSVADEAWLMLLRIAAANRQLAETVEYLGHISADSPWRGEAELLAGQALWAAYLDAANLPQQQRPSKAEMAKMSAEAGATLKAGIGRLRDPVDAGREVSYNLTAAALSLAQICLEAGRADEAVAWLDDPKIGPHTLVQANGPLADRGNFRIETLKAAVRAYAAAQQLDKAQQTMMALEKTGGGPNLTRIYLGLGRQLEQSLERARAEGDRPRAEKLAQGFGAFLSQLSARPAKEVGFGTLNWAAKTFASLGASLDTDDGKRPAEADEYYQKAANAYRAILEACRADKDFVPRPEAVYGIQMQLARCLRQMGEYAQSMDVLVDILKTRNNLISVQREAALTYQAWGQKKPGYYILAIRGGRKAKKKDGALMYVVWGWGGIARRVQSNAAYQDVFYEARYNLALCRYDYAWSKSGRQRTDLLEQAKRDIVIVHKLYPKMGGQAWFDQYDALLKKIQKDLGVKPAGLAKLD